MVIDAEKELMKQCGQNSQETYELIILLKILSPKEYMGKPYSLIQEEETFEYVNGHGNETGVMGTRMVEKVIWDGIKYTYSELNEIRKKT